MIARLFSVELQPGAPGYPQAVAPSALILILALLVGWLGYRRGWPLLPMTAVAFALVLLGVGLSPRAPTLGLAPQRWPGPIAWTWILMGYALLACVLPVWSLLQPRDFINSLLLYLGLLLGFAGFFALGPSFQAPVVDLHPEGAPSLFPFVFIVIACGAASGFHSLVASGTTAKQIDRESHARPIGYGGMIGESLLGLLAVIATTAGLGSAADWQHRYASWGAISGGLAAQISAFIDGAASFLGALGIPRDLGASFMAIVVVSFALTTLDSATRILRYNIEEMTRSLRLPRPLARLIGQRHVASLLAVGVILWFALYEVGGRPVALALWTLFGTTNQLLAGLALLLATVYLKQRGRAWWCTGVPMLFMLASTLTAMSKNLLRFVRPADPHHSWLLAAVGGAILLLGIWLCVEAAVALWQDRRHEGLEVPLPPEAVARAGGGAGAAAAGGA
ncbi:MAG: hypothetical protein KatS3mg102_2851 [Planctomycetota bacterium]|nr:MAG: hypothetical protein KatS3mg102_2851 [Planctomycetota bacterium]